MKNNKQKDQYLFYQPLYSQSKENSAQTTKLSNLSQTSSQPVLLEKNGITQWSLQIEPDYFSIDQEPQVIYAEIPKVNRFSEFANWLTKRWKWGFSALLFWTISHYSPIYLTWINNNVSALSWWIIQQLKIALEYQIKDISVFNWIFYTFATIPLIKLISETIVDFPTFIQKRITDNNLKAKQELYQRQKEYFALIQQKRQSLLDQIQEDQEFLRRCRIIVHNQTLEDEQNYQVLSRKLGSTQTIPTDQDQLKRMLVDCTKNIHSSLRNKVNNNSLTNKNP